MKWEYFVVDFSPGEGGIEQLNKLGDQGWEAVTIDPAGWLILKRRKPN